MSETSTQAPSRAFPLEEVLATNGTDLGYSSWRTIDQDLINSFADTTGDHQWIHTDPVRAAEGPFGTTIAHGLLTLGLTPDMRDEIGGFPTHGIGQLINYGYDEIRFVSPVRVNSRVRMHVKVIEARPRARGALVTTFLTMEIEGEKRPALTAKSITLLLP